MNAKYFEEVFENKAILLEDSQIAEIRDIHLVLDFFKDKTWGGKNTPRSNRMYLNHDVDNSELLYMEKLHAYIRDPSNPKIDVLALGGF